MDIYQHDTTKYDVPLKHLDHGYIEKCKDDKELEKIVKVLRSGCEGTYPDLEHLAEKRLEEVNPKSKVLRKQLPAAKISDLQREERAKLLEDLQLWENQMKDMEDSLAQSAENKPTDGSTSQKDTPPVRGTQAYIPMDKSGGLPKSQKKPLPRSHADWDKVNIDAELEKVDGEENRKISDLPKDKGTLPETVVLSSLTEEERTLKADREKDKGNEAFRAGDFDEALVYYKRSISIQPSVAAYNNRAQAYLKLEKWNEAYRDCNMVLSMDNTNLKAYLRRGVASQGKKDFKKSMQDLQYVLEQEPNNARAQQVLEQVRTSLDTQKVKGHRIVIEEVEGSDEDEPKSPFKIINGHQIPKEQLTNARLIEEMPNEKVKKTDSTTKKDEVTINGHDKDIWTEEELNESETMKESESETPKLNESEIPKVNESETDLKPPETSSSADYSSTGKSQQGSQDSTDESILDQTTTGIEPESKKNFVQTKPIIKINMQPENGSNDKSGAVKSADTSEVTTSSRKSDEEVGEQTLPSPPRVPSPPPELPASVVKLKDAGNQLFKTGQYPEAIGYYDKAIQKLIKESGAHGANLAVLYSNRAACRHKIGQCNACIDDCNEALKLTPGSIKPLLRRAMANEALEKYRLAYVDYRQVLFADGTMDVAQQGSSRCTRHLRDEDGPQWREKLPTILPTTAPSLQSLQNQPSSSSVDYTPPTAPALQAQQASGQKADQTKPPKVDKLEKQLPKSETKPADKALSKEEKMEKHKSEGNAFVKNGDYKSAIKCYTSCLACSKVNIAAFTNRALCYLKLNMFDDVVEDCREALKLDPNNVKALFRRALAYKELKSYENSVNDLKQLLKLDPKNTPARKEFAQILREKQEHEQKLKTEAASKPRQRVQIQEIESSSEEEENTLPLKQNKTSAKKPTEQQKQTPPTPKPDPTPEVKADECAKPSQLNHEQSAKSKKSRHKGNKRGARKTSSSDNQSTTSPATEDKAKPAPNAKQSDSEKCEERTDNPHVNPCEPDGAVDNSSTDRLSQDHNKSSVTDTTAAFPTTKAAKADHKIRKTTDVLGVSSKENVVPTLGKATPFEFMQAWNSLKGTKNIDQYSKLLEQVAPEDLKKVLSNKLEGDMLVTLVRCIGILVESSDGNKALQYLKHLPRVPRFQMIAMFMSNQDKQEVSSTVAKLQEILGEALCAEDLKYIKKEFGLK